MSSIKPAVYLQKFKAVSARSLDVVVQVVRIVLYYGTYASTIPGTVYYYNTVETVRTILVPTRLSLYSTVRYEALLF